MSAPVSYTNDARTIAQAGTRISISPYRGCGSVRSDERRKCGIKERIFEAGGQLDFVLGGSVQGRQNSSAARPPFSRKDGTRESSYSSTPRTAAVVTDARPCARCTGVAEYGKVNLKGLTACGSVQVKLLYVRIRISALLIQEAEKMRIWPLQKKR